MNQYIIIIYNPTWSLNPNYWDIWFYLNNKYHREKSPSVIRNNGYWNWFVQDELQKKGYYSDWNKQGIGNYIMNFKKMEKNLIGVRNESIY